ncbi:MAG: glycosyltransferase family 2 protein [Candidatus Eremiobacteraeota bacterium]|nr:glycosyltransferase family 2 protein [Candidatus Eremiobacteraeota bacterium]
MKPEVDVVILSFNRTESTIQAIESALAQEGVRVKVWVIEQGTKSDLTALRQACHPEQIQLVELGSNIGVAAGRNLGARLGKAPCIAFLDNDADFVESDLLAQASHILGSRVAVVGLRLVEAATGKLDRLNWVYPDRFQCEEEPKLVGRFAGGACVLSRRAFESTEGFDEALFFMDEEVELSYQLVQRGYQILYHPGLSVRHYLSGENRIEWADGRYAHHTRNMLYITWKHYRSWTQVLILGLGYLLKGALNGLSGEAYRGWRSGLSLCRRTKRGEPLSKDARAYLKSHHDAYRGGVRGILFQEVLSKLPQARPASQNASHKRSNTFNRQASDGKNV